jgi:hypothetical protein
MSDGNKCDEQFHTVIYRSRRKDERLNISGKNILQIKLPKFVRLRKLSVAGRIAPLTSRIVLLIHDCGKVNGLYAQSRMIAPL